MELKTIADVGLIGFPNVGKSTLLSKVSSARPKIANYHFTTLSPNLGVVSRYDESFVVADIPGLIEGASEGAGLGIEFLKHIERTRMLVHVVDISGMEGRDPYDDFIKINAELKGYSETLASLQQIVVANKCDSVLWEEEPYVRDFEKHIASLGYPLFFVSAVTGEGIEELLRTVRERLDELPPVKVYEREISAEEDAIRSAADEKETTVKVEGGVYYVEGKWLYNFMGQINFDDYQSLSFFSRVLQKNGVIDLLREHGAKDGDTVNIYDFEFDFVQ
jgi:GTP-binding protein